MAGAGEAEEVVVAEAAVAAEAVVVVVGPAEEEKDELGRVAAGPVEVESAPEGCRPGPGAQSAHALPVIPKPPISPASPALIGTVRTAGPE